MEIEKVTEAADMAIIYPSNNSVTKRGTVQQELRFVSGIYHEVCAAGIC